MRLIDAEALLEKAWDVDCRCGYVQVVDVGSIEDAPTIEATRNEFWKSLGAYETENGRMYLDLEGIRLVIFEGKIEGWYIP